MDTTTRRPASAAAEHPDDADGTILYAGDLGEDHPGFSDLGYRARRAEIGHIGAEHRRGAAIMQVPYIDAEHEVWRQVTTKLNTMFDTYAPAELVEANERFGLPTDHVPQLDEVSEILTPLTDFSYEPVPGLVAPKAFYGTLKDGIFQSTQYIRHSSAPFYTPEPDVIHEVAGHGIHLSSDRFTRMYRLVGAAVDAAQTPAAIAFVSRFFWHTMEFGIVRDTVG
ncbi:MAG: phenylalanine-4-hydroxylase, partial [Glaciecola sp.]